MKFGDYITEERLSSQDKKTLMKIIDNPKNGTIELKDGTKIIVKKKNDSISITYDKNNFEVTDELVNILDKAELSFDSDIKNKDIVFIID